MTLDAGGRKPLCIDLFCGLGGWTEGFLAEGWDVIGFDIERHSYGEQRYPAQLVIQDVLTLDGRQLLNADCIVASPPCQEYSYMAMPWSRAKQIAMALREEEPDLFPEGYVGSRTVSELTALFDACFRIQREACEFAGRYIPMVVENVKGAQPWVGRAKANFGSFYFWGDVAMVGRQVVAGRPQFGRTVKAARRGMKADSGGSWFRYVDGHPTKSNDPRDLRKDENGNWVNAPNGVDAAKGSTERLVDLIKFAAKNYPEELDAALKVPGISFSGYGEPEYKPQGFNVTAAQRYRGENGTKQKGSGPEWFDNGIAKHSSRSDSRKAASAQIAKIPFPLANYIARSFKPPALPPDGGETK
jgi:hypothetical protein